MRCTFLGCDKTPYLHVKACVLPHMMYSPQRLVEGEAILPYHHLYTTKEVTYERHCESYMYLANAHVMLRPLFSWLFEMANSLW